MGGSGLRGVRLDVIEELNFLGKFKKKLGSGGVWLVGGGGGVGLVGGQGGRIEVFVKIQKKKKIFFGGGGGPVGGGGGQVGGGGQCRCDLRIKVFGKIHKKNWGGRGGRVGGVGSGWI